MKHKSKNILIKVWIFLSFLLFSCSTPVSSSAHTAEEHIETSITLQTPQIQMMDIQTSPILRKNSAATLQARGKVEVPHQNLVQISFPFEGNVQNISVLEGSPVIKNQKLAQIESLSFICRIWLLLTHDVIGLRNTDIVVFAKREREKPVFGH